MKQKKEMTCEPKDMMLRSLRATILKKSVFFSIMGTEHGLLVLHLYSDFCAERIKFVPCYGKETRSML